MSSVGTHQRKVWLSLDQTHRLYNVLVHRRILSSISLNDEGETREFNGRELFQSVVRYSCEIITFPVLHLLDSVVVLHYCTVVPLTRDLYLGSWSQFGNLIISGTSIDWHWKVLDTSQTLKWDEDSIVQSVGVKVSGTTFYIVGFYSLFIEKVNIVSSVVFEVRT